MLLRMLTSGEPLGVILIQIILLLLALVIVLPVHECAHAYIAYKLGDDTQIYQGRMSLNPLRHLDPMGALCLLLTGFGWAKPVYVDGNRLRRGGRYAELLVSAAGPLSNLLVGFLFCMLTNGLLTVFEGIAVSQQVFFWLDMLFTFLMIVFQISINLAVVNLIPVPPFDGYGILSAFLPARAKEFVAKNQRYITLLFLVLLVTGAVSTPVGWVSEKIQALMKAVLGAKW